MDIRTFLMFLVLSGIFVETKGEHAFASGGVSRCALARVTGAPFPSSQMHLPPSDASPFEESGTSQLSHEARRLPHTVEQHEEPTPGGARLRSLFDTTGITKQKQGTPETFLLVSIPDERSLQEVLEGARARFSVTGLPKKTGNDKQTRPHASELREDEKICSRECPREASGPPVVVRLSQRLKLMSFGLSNAVCLEDTPVMATRFNADDAN